jgi:hypothetical protein
MNKMFVPSFLFGHDQPQRGLAVPKWSPAPLDGLNDINSVSRRSASDKSRRQLRVSLTRFENHVEKTSKSQVFRDGKRGFVMSACGKEMKRQPLTLDEVQQAFSPLQNKYKPILSLEEAAELIGYTPGTLKKKLSEGSFVNSATRGKPVLFWRDRLILEAMNRPAPSSRREVKANPETTGAVHHSQKGERNEAH